MAKSRERREKRTGARRRAEQHATGFENTVLTVPEGIGFWSPKVGTYKIDIVPFKAGQGNPWAEPGDDYYERTYYSYRRIGAEEKNYVAPGKTFGHPDPIAEWVAKAANREDVDAPKERQLFLVWDHTEPEKGVKIWDISFHLFGKLLDFRINESDDNDNWDQFDDPTEHGFTLKLMIKQETAGGYNFNDTKAIDFIQRNNALPDNIKNHGICLDDLLVEIPYDKLKAIFMGSVDSEPDPSNTGEDDNDPQKEKPEPQAEVAGPEDKKEPDDDPTASDLGLSVDDAGTYKGLQCRIVKISGDGTSLLLMDENDDVHKAIAPRDFKINRRDTIPVQDESELDQNTLLDNERAAQIADTNNTSGTEDDLDEDWD